MNILYNTPFLNTRYAGRSIYYGYKHAFEELGHTFKFLTTEDDLHNIIKEFSPDIFFFSLNKYATRYLDIDWLLKYKREHRNLKTFVWIPFWNSPLSKLRINETPSLSQMPDMLEILKSGLCDFCYSQVDENDPRMEGFERETGFKYYSIPLAADTFYMSSVFDKKFEADISFIGTLLPEKREFIKNNVLPLKKEYDLKLYGQDWTFPEKVMSFSKKVGQYFNIPVLKDIQKPSLSLEDEAKIYKSSIISINVHEDYQKRFGKDCNERTFKIPLYGGFEITDDVAVIRKYFKEGEEIVIAEDSKDWYEKIDYYIKNPEKRIKIMEAGKARVLKDHTYINRAKKIIDLYKGKTVS
jgi:hypothetical protein